MPSDIASKRAAVFGIRVPVAFAAQFRSVHVALLSLSLLSAGIALSADPPVPEKTVVARGESLALASVCTDGQYMLLLTGHPDTEPWRADLRAAEETDRVAFALRFGDSAEGNEWHLYRIAGVPGAWSIPNGRTFTGTLEGVSVPQELDLRVWLPGDDRSRPGRFIERLTQEVVARMWLTALTC